MYSSALYNFQTTKKSLPSRISVGVDVISSNVTEISWYHSLVLNNISNASNSIAKWKPSKSRGKVDDEKREWNLAWDEFKGSAVVVGVLWVER